jgi:16S rRNA (guanine527-N7)-methyltransferase
VLKGGDLQAELAPYKKTAEVTPCSQWFKGEWFETKQVIYLPM